MTLVCRGPAAWAPLVCGATHWQRTKSTSMSVLLQLSRCLPPSLLPSLPPCMQNLPMRVEYMTDVGLLQNVVLNFLELDEVNSSTTWELADVKANQNVKGRGLSKKQRMQRFDVPLESLERVRIYVDF